jgi:hypothetical protein
MSLSPRAVAALLTMLLVPPLAFMLLGPDDDVDPAVALATPALTSPNVKAVTSRPGTAAISGVFSPSAPYFYTSGLDSIRVFDVTNPRNPILRGVLPNVVFENEAMTYGERRRRDGSTQRFVLVGNDLGQVSVDSGGVSRGRLGGRELIIVDVTDPSAPRVAGRTPSVGPGAVTTSTHTVACISRDCTLAYSAGDGGEFSVLDLTDLAAPRQVATVPSPAAGPNPVFADGSGHHWNVDGAGVAWHTGSGGAAAFDLADPLRPRLLNTTDANGIAPGWNDFIHHNSERPNAMAFAAGRPASIANGNVLLVTEEDYANDGDEVVCDRAGSFQTWEVTDLAGQADGTPGAGRIRPLDRFNAPAEGGSGAPNPVGGFCSAHWFDVHQSGIVAQGYYQQGLRLVDVRDARNLSQFGYATGGGSQVWDAYWVPQRRSDGRVVGGGKKTNLIYSVDAVRGLDVYEVSNLPAR